MNTYNTALQWHSIGISVIPVLVGSKRPAIASWEPYTSRLPTETELRAWFRDTRYNIAVLTGNGLVIIDWDDMWLYSRWLCSLDGAFAKVAQTFRVKTARGLHLYYWCAEKAFNMHGNGWDVKGHHGCCMTPPSFHPSGAQYEAIGQPSNILRIDSVNELLPDYEQQRAIVEQAQQHVRDPLAAAMRGPMPMSGQFDLEKIKRELLYETMVKNLCRNGRSRRGTCPLHDDRVASFVIYADGHYHCFGCGAHGRDQITLYGAIHRLDFGETIRELAGEM